jgi:hypothetical protein
VRVSVVERVSGSVIELVRGLLRFSSCEPLEAITRQQLAKTADSET